MRRRKLLASLLLLVPGCSSSPPSTSTPTDTQTPTNTVKAQTTTEGTTDTSTPTPTTTYNKPDKTIPEHLIQPDKDFVLRHTEVKGTWLVESSAFNWEIFENGPFIEIYSGFTAYTSIK
ncbi:MAG: hypothetical protein ABEI06_06455, partial [Halobacteriaceae archaeon]